LGAEVTDVVEIAQEQKYFDHALECREHSRQVLQSAPEAGVSKGAAAGLRKYVTDRPAAAPDEAVAFGRIDRDDGDTYYIGKDAIFNEEKDILVVTWRAPVATPFYEATVADPSGVARKRTYECQHNDIIDIDDVLFADLAASVAALEEPVVNDSLLRELDRTRTGEMHEIVETIAAAQHALIRSDLDQMLVVQGGPGTGKTVVALHRVSWLLYNNRERLRPEDVLVIGPNRAFVRYIREVLPSLGDQDVAQRALQTLAPQVRRGRAEVPEVAYVKGQARMCGMIDRGLDARIGLPDDELELRVAGNATRFRAPDVEAQLERLRSQPYAAGRQLLRDWMREQATRSASAPDFSNLLENLLDRVWPQLSAAAMLRELFGSEARLLRAAGDDFSAREVRLLYRKSADRLTDETWSDEDLALLDYADFKINGLPSERFGHIVIDEAQDLSPMQLGSIARRSRTGSMTVLGDLAQSYGVWARDSWDDVIEALRTNLDVRIEQLRYGYRVPRQVFELASRLLPTIAPSVEAPVVVRDGPSDPRFVSAAAGDLETATRAVVLERSAMGNSVGVICPDEAFDAVAAAFDDAGVTWRDVREHGPGGAINLLHASDARGLEFDAAVVVEPDSIMREVASGGRLLYVALTRTTKHLAVVHSTPLDWLQQTPPSPTTLPRPTEGSDSNTEGADDITAADDLGRLGSAIARELAQELRGTVKPSQWRDVLREIERLLEVD
jgi:DNA helicase IV